MSKLILYTLFVIALQPLFSNILPWRISYPYGNYLKINEENFNITLISKPILSCYNGEGLTYTDLKALNLPNKIFEYGQIVFCGINAYGEIVVIKKNDGVYSSFTYESKGDNWMPINNVRDIFFIGMINYMNQFASLGE